MASPVGHSLVGVAVARLVRRPEAARPVAWYFYCAALASAADFDFLLGLAAGRMNQFHRGASHSLGVAVAVGLLAALMLGRRWRPGHRVLFAGIAAYGSHIVLDLFCGHPPDPAGQPIFWPLSTLGCSSPWIPLPGIEHGPDGAGFGEFCRKLLCWKNLHTICLEVLYVAPFSAAVWLLTRPGPAAERAVPQPAVAAISVPAEEGG